MDSDLSARLKFACDAAHEAGRLTLRYFQRADLQIDLKQDATPVTVADREAEQLLRQRIAASFPDDGVLGEEFGEQLGTSGYRWILDPIDGTKSFIHGVPLYSVLIGVEHEGQSRLGVIHVPVLQETAYAAKGQGAWYIRGDQPPKPARVSATKTLADGLFLTSSLSGFHKRGALAIFRTPLKNRAAHPHLGRCLRLPAGGHRPGRSDGRSDHERLGRRRLTANSARSRRHVHRLARPANDPRRRRNRLQRLSAG